LYTVVLSCGVRDAAAGSTSLPKPDTTHHHLLSVMQSSVSKPHVMLLLLLAAPSQQTRLVMSMNEVSIPTTMPSYGRQSTGGGIDWSKACNSSTLGL
jgi:hypothetical protein